MKMYMKNIIVFLVMLSQAAIALPIKLINNNAEFIWINSDWLKGIVGPTGIKEFEQKGFFIIDAPLAQLRIISDLIVQFNAHQMTQLPEHMFKQLVSNYVRGVSVGFEDLLGVLSIAQQYFDSVYQDVLCQAIAQKLGNVEIDLSQTDLTDDNKDRITMYLRELYPPKNAIGSIQDVIQNTRLDHGEGFIDLGGRGIQTIAGVSKFAPFAQLVKGYVLDLDNNAIKVIDHIDIMALSTIADTLEVVSLIKNAIEFIGHGFLKNAHMLTYVALGDNQLKELPEDFLSYNTTLEELDLSDNQLRQLPHNFLETARKINFIDLSNNQLTQLPDNFLSEHSEIRQIRLHGNKLTRLPASFLRKAPESVKLYLADNNFTDEYLRSLPEKIQKSIQDIDFERHIKRKRDDSEEEELIGVETEPKKAKGAD